MAARARLIVNPAAGGGKAGRLAPAAERALATRGLEVTRSKTRDVAHARELARDAAAGGETVLSLSGDGLVGVIADELRAVPGAVLGVLPGGRGNDLARVLGIPEEIDAAAAIAAGGHTRMMDLGAVREVGAGDGARAAGGQHAAGGLHPPGRPQPAGDPRAGDPSTIETSFVGIASVGFDSDANRIANEAPAWLGGMVYVYGALRALAAWRPARFDIHFDPPDGERRTFTGFSVGAANSRAYGGGMYAAPEAMLDDGLLDVVVLEDVGKRRFLTSLLPKVFKGTHLQEPGVHCFRAREVEIAADRPFTMYADGDPIGRLPVRVRALHGAVAVLTPATGADEAFSAR